MSTDTATTHLRRLGINPITIARLQQWADEDGMTLAEFVRYILTVEDRTIQVAAPPEPKPLPPDYWETAQ